MPTERKRTKSPSRRERVSTRAILKEMQADGEALPVRRKEAGPQARRKQELKRANRRKAREEAGGSTKCGGFNLLGEPCKAAPLHKGTMIQEYEASGEYCLFHDPLIPTEVWKNRFTGGARVARPLELLADAVNKAPALLFEPHFRTLGMEWDADAKEMRPEISTRTGKRARGATHIGFSRDGVAKKSPHRDLALQMRAADTLADRLFGKARVSMEIGGAMGVGMVKIPPDKDRAMEVADILAEVGALPDQKARKTGKTGKKST